VSLELLIAGGGIGGLAAAVAARRAGWQARVLEQAPAFGEAGAGLQLGPNSTRILREWRLLDGDLRGTAVQPSRLVVRDALDGGTLGVLPLADFDARYGAPYLTVHRADLHSALLNAAGAAGVQLHADRRVQSVLATESDVRVTCNAGEAIGAAALVGADGLWSSVRAFVAGAHAPRFTGHLAYRALLRQSDLPQVLRSDEVTAWLGPRMHLVTYPVRAGEFLNVVCVVEGARPAGDASGWDHAATAAQLHAALGPVGRAARERIESVAQWRCWALHDRPGLVGAQHMAQGRVALLGDAAHPMLPYLAQGAGMALEDARELQRALASASDRSLDPAAALRGYAQARWQRCARVQARSQRNARIFHARGALRLARNASLRWGGERLLDLPWLYNR
jgi:salicylate hydroxylase